MGFRGHLSKPSQTLSIGIYISHSIIMIMGKGGYVLLWVFQNYKPSFL